jgi:hypothetical protein
MVTPTGSMSTEGEYTPSFCPTLQALDMCTLGDAADVNPEIKFLTTPTHAKRTSMTNTYCCAYSVETPDDGQ